MPNPNIFFYKGEEEVLKKVIPEDYSEIKSIKKIQDSFNKVLDGKNLSLLLGSGCSSYTIETNAGEGGAKPLQVGVQTMLPLANYYFEHVLIKEKAEWLKTSFNLDVEKPEIRNNIEKYLGILHSISFYLNNTSQNNEEHFIELQSIILNTRNYLLQSCLNQENRDNGKDKPLVKLYMTFYRKLLYRGTNLPKPNIFTTNYDLYSEIALDKLGVHYVNGFSGGIRKYFNPTIFNYALAEKMDLSQTKWNVIDNFIYLYKVHGSVNWIEDQEESKLFQVRELQEISLESLKNKELIMIHPTPMKQNASMGSPYSDLFREFQKKLMQNNNVLITIGYSFSDEHINNLIYQAFTIPSFRLIIMGDPTQNCELTKLKSLDDPRIWIIGGSLDDGSKLHYFKGFVEQVLPNLTNDEIDSKIESAIRTLLQDR